MDVRTTKNDIGEIAISIALTFCTHFQCKIFFTHVETLFQQYTTTFECNSLHSNIYFLQMVITNRRRPIRYFSSNRRHQGLCSREMLIIERRKRLIDRLMQGIDDCPTDEGKEELEVALGHTIISYFGMIKMLPHNHIVYPSQNRTIDSKSYCRGGVKSNCIDYLTCCFSLTLLFLIMAKTFQGRRFLE